MVNWFQRFNIVSRLWRAFKISMFAVGVLTFVGVAYFVFQPPVHRNLGVAMLTSELERRVEVCEASIDSLSPDFATTAAFHCGMMWQQSNKLKMYMKVYKVQDHQATLALVAAIHAAYRFAEYQAMLNNPIFQPKSDD